MKKLILTAAFAAFMLVGANAQTPAKPAVASAPTTTTAVVADVPDAASAESKPTKETGFKSTNHSKQKPTKDNSQNKSGFIKHLQDRKSVV
jgi:hypothetical protein